MPTDHQHDDKALSDLLAQIEPPKSPSHLDEAILKRARQKAEALRETGQSQGWLTAAQWRSAIAVFSVAAIAISVSLPLFDEQEMEDAVRLESAQAPAQNAQGQQQEQSAVADQVTLAFDQNSNVSSDTPQSLQAPALAEETVAAALAESVETDRAAADGDAVANAPSPLSRSATASRAVAPTQQGLASTATRSVESREQAAAGNTFDPDLLNLLAAVLLNEELAEAEAVENRQQQAELTTQLLSTYQQLAAEQQELSRQQYAERRTALANDNLPDTLDQALELIRP